MVHFGNDDDAAPPPTPIGSSLADAGLDIPDLDMLDDETQRFVLETHMENIGVFDFLGFELASLVAAQYDNSRSKLPPVAVAANKTRKSGSKMGDAAVYVTLFKSFVGIGILSLPYGMSLGGYVGGPVGLVIIAILAHHCMQLLMSTADSTAQKLNAKVTSFGAVATKTCGPRAKVVVEACMVATQYGCCVAYIIFITENVRDVVCLETHNAACPSKIAICIGIVMLLQPLSWLRSLNVLAIPTLMSNFVVLGGLVWVFYCAIGNIASGKAGEEEADLVAVNWSHLPVFFGMAVFTFEGICLVLPIREAMSDPSRLPQQLREVMVVLVLLFTLFGLISYISYRGGVHEMITFNLPKTNKITSFMRLFYCLGLFCSYPVMMHPVHCLNESKFRCLKGSSRLLRRLTLRTCLVVLSGMVALSIPHFGLFLSLLGSLACGLLAFVLPALFHYYRPDREDANRLDDGMDIFLIAFGLVAGAVAFTVTLRELITEVWSEM